MTQWKQNRRLTFLFLLAASLGTMVANTAESKHPSILPIVWKGKHGLIDRGGNLLLKPVFDDLGTYHASGHGMVLRLPPIDTEAWMAVQVGPHYGYANRRSEIVIEPKWSKASAFRDGRAQVCLNERWGLIDLQGNYLVEPTFSYLGDFYEGRARVAVGERSRPSGRKWGFIDESGKVIVPPTYDDVRDFDQGRALVNVGAKRGGESGNALRGGLWGVVDQQGSVLIKPQMEVDQQLDLKAFDPQRGFLPVTHQQDRRRIKIEGRYGFADKRWSIVIESRFSDAGQFSEGFAAVKLGQKWGYVDGQGRMVVEPSYDLAGPFGEGLAPVQLGGEVRYIDAAGNAALIIRAEAGEPFANGVARVRVGELWGFINRTGELLLSPQFTRIIPRDGGYQVTGTDGKQGLVDEAGRLIVSPQYDFIGGFQSNGLAWAGVGFMGEQLVHTLIDRSGKVVSSAETYRYQPRKQGDLWGIWDSQEDCYAIEPRFSDLKQLDVGILQVTVKSRYGMVDLNTGTMLLEAKYFSMRPFYEGLALVQAPNQRHPFGFVDRTGTFVIPPIFDDASNFEDGLASVRFFRRPVTDLLWIDKTGRYLWDPRSQSEETSEPAGLIGEQ
ncbi:WG repeat-containing protein [Lacipirellula sp.]|uniref:WG repeat-containing protein n=1 Tax=Lacipirellula sp. TaxID=2691419 RepID=UPI003D0B502C